jgi:hypothetical protein
MCHSKQKFVEERTGFGPRNGTTARKNTGEHETESSRNWKEKLNKTAFQKWMCKSL